MAWRIGDSQQELEFLFRDKDLHTAAAAAVSQEASPAARLPGCPAGLAQLFLRFRHFLSSFPPAVLPTEDFMAFQAAAVAKLSFPSSQKWRKSTFHSGSSSAAFIPKCWSKLLQGMCCKNLHRRSDVGFTQPSVMTRTPQNMLQVEFFHFGEVATGTMTAAAAQSVRPSVLPSSRRPSISLPAHFHRCLSSRGRGREASH